MKAIHIIKSHSVRHDVRVLKWLNSIESFGIDSDVLTLEDSNIQSKYSIGESSVYSYRLCSRKIFPKKGSGQFLKIPEYTFRVFWKLLTGPKYDVYIFHDNQGYAIQFFIALFGLFRTKRIVWDMHELIHQGLINNFLTKRILQFILNRTDFVLHTNSFRRDYLKSKIDYNEYEYAILNNFPSENYINRKRASIPYELSNWLDDSDYVLWMGGALKKRNFESVIRSFAAIDQDNLRLVVMGSIEEEMKLLVSKLGIDNKIFSKFVSQDEIPGYVDNAKFSVVLYENVSMNNWYCEPNRLYQLITRGVPVIVGNNPPLKNIVEETGAGIVLDDDGSDQYSMKSALSKMMNDKEFNKYIAALKRPYVKNLYTWESQINLILKRILN